MNADLYKEPYHEYPSKLRQKALACVFDSIVFDDPKFGQIVRSSYFGNLLPMMRHAHSQRIDELEYLLDIRDILLKMNGVHER